MADCNTGLDASSREPREAVYYTAEMTDAELDKLLNKLGHKIAEAIKDRDAALPPPPARTRFTTMQAALGLIVSVFVIVGCLWAGLNYVVSSAINSALRQPFVDMAAIKEQGAGLRRDVDRLLDRVAKEVFQAPAKAGTKDAAREIKNAAEWASERKINVDPTDIRKASEILFKSRDQESWQATLALLKLRSIVNSTFSYAVQHIGATVEGSEDTIFPPIKPGEWLEFKKARFKLDGNLGEKGLLRSPDGTPARILRNLIVKDSIVEYRGGTITLVNVFFENCIFVISSNDNGWRMAQSILDPAPFTSFASD
jgi:hypothetical protein